MIPMIMSIDKRPGVDVYPELVKHVLGDPFHFLLNYQLAAPLAITCVFNGRERIYQIEFLVDTLSECCLD